MSRVAVSAFGFDVVTFRFEYWNIGRGKGHCFKPKVFSVLLTLVAEAETGPRLEPM